MRHFSQQEEISLCLIEIVWIQKLLLQVNFFIIIEILCTLREMLRVILTNTFQIIKIKFLLYNRKNFFLILRIDFYL